MFKLRRWTMAFILVFLAIFLVACNKEKRTDKEVVMDVVEFFKEELPEKTFGDFIIPEYKKNKKVVIEIVPRTSLIKDGVWLYNRPNNDYREFLDFKVSYGSYQTAFTYIVEVYGVLTDFDKFIIADDDLKAWAEKLGKDITKNIELPKEAVNLGITWYTDNAKVITTSGEYIRPNDDTLVRLTAVIKSGDASFSSVLVFNAKGFTQEEKIEYLKTEGVLKDIYGKAGSKNLVFPSTTSRFNFQIEWKSSNVEVLAHDGEFMNPAADTDLTITATVRYKMGLVDPKDPSKGYKKLDQYSFEQVVEIPYTVKALATALDRAAYDASKNELKLIPKHFYYGMVDGDAIKNLPTTVAGHEGFTLTWENEDGHFVFNEENNSLKLNVQPLLYKQTIVTMIVSDGTDSTKLDILVNIGFLEENQIGISTVSGVSQFFNRDDYNTTNGFGNRFDGGNNIPTRDFNFGGLIFKSTFKWYHADPKENPDADYTETDFFYFFRDNSIIKLKETDLVAEGEGEDAKYRVKELEAKLSGSYVKAIHNPTDKDAVIAADQLKTCFGFTQHAAYQLYIYDGEGNQVLAHPGAKVADPEAGTPAFEYVIPAGGYIIERGYIDGAATNAFLSQALKVEFITLRRHEDINKK